MAYLLALQSTLPMTSSFNSSSRLSEMDPEAGVHLWRYSHNNETMSEVQFKHRKMYCDEVVEEMANYLLAIGFLPGSIIEAFEGYVWENRPLFGKTKSEDELVGGSK